MQKQDNSQGKHTTSASHKASPSNHHQLPQQRDYSPISWDVFFDQLCYLDDGTSVFRAGKQGALYFCIHGAGHSALSFSRLAKQIKHFGTLVAYDLKGHGYSKHSQNLADFSIQRLCQQGQATLLAQMKKWPQKNVVLIGHALGGSIATHLADKFTNSDPKSKVVGLIVLDAVQGTAIQSFPFMNQILEAKQKKFHSVESAIKWSLSSGAIRRINSARISIPPQLKTVQQDGKTYYMWKNDLKTTQQFWLSWFKGLSHLFLKAKISKVMIIADKQRLDKELTIAETQGKYKLEIVHNGSHLIHEDNFKQLARIIYQFVYDFRLPMDDEQVKRKQEVGIANFHPKLKPY